MSSASIIELERAPLPETKVEPPRPPTTHAQCCLDKRVAMCGVSLGGGKEAPWTGATADECVVCEDLIRSRYCIPVEGACDRYDKCRKDLQ